MVDRFFHPFIELNTASLEYFSVLGRALFTVQHLETNCRALAAYLEMRTEGAAERPGFLGSPEFHDKIDKLWRRTLGRQIQHLQEAGVFPGGISEILEDALEARNEIAHSVTVGIGDDLDSKVEERIDEMRSLVKKIAAADKRVAALLHAGNRDPLPTDQFFLEYGEKVADWVCGPGSGG